MTNTQLKTQIDTDITNKVANNSITPTNIGINTKAVVDYVDQQNFTKQIKVSLTSAELLALDVTPKLLISAVANKLIRLRSVHQRYNHNTTAYTHTGLDRIAYGTIGNWLHTIPLVITSAQDTYGFQDFSINSSTSTDYTGLSIILTATSAITLGDGTLDLYLTYDEISIS